MRVVRFSLAAVCLAAGAVVGALNREAVTIDFGPVALHSTLGVSLIGALLVGALVGGAAIALGTARAAAVPVTEACGPSRSET